jgi:hypothetical protein
MPPRNGEGKEAVQINKPANPPSKSTAFRRRSNSAPPTTARRRLLDQHFRVDPERKQVLPGLPKHEEDWSRDVHDFFNLIALVPIVVLNMMNWNWEMITKMPPDMTMVKAWNGDWFTEFWLVTFLYFVIDLTWMFVEPSCVKSPMTIIQHHIATILYILIPYLYAEYQWCMGACMSVEINTWFLIARRVFNKQGFPPWVIGLPTGLSIRIKLISIFFYVTWISIRVILYPYLMYAFYVMWTDTCAKDGSIFNALLIVQPLHLCFVLLNLKWTHDLLMSKVRYWRRPKGSKKAEYVSKGL